MHFLKFTNFLGVRRRKATPKIEEIAMAKGNIKFLKLTLKPSIVCNAYKESGLKRNIFDK